MQKEKFANENATAIAVIEEAEVVQNSGPNAANVMEHVENTDHNLLSEIVR